MDSEKDIEKEHVLSKRLNKIIQARIENDEVRHFFIKFHETNYL